jgi:hypothetical protein
MAAGSTRSKNKRGAAPAAAIPAATGSKRNRVPQRGSATAAAAVAAARCYGGGSSSSSAMREATCNSAVASKGSGKKRSRTQFHAGEESEPRESSVMIMSTLWRACLMRS